LEARTTTTPYGCAEHPFNLIYLAEASGAVYVARWTALHTYELRDAIMAAMNKRGFSFIEVVSPCPTGYARRNKLGTTLDLMRYFKDNSYVTNELDPEKTALPFNPKVAVGTFVDTEKPTFLDLYERCILSKAGYVRRSKKR
jgi:2-oxoglutarate ferredoxin oxidoreductase subunit beta